MDNFSQSGSIKISPEIHKKLKIYAVTNSVTVSSAAEKAIKAMLGVAKK